jgi:hypothetical protein
MTPAYCVTIDFLVIEKESLDSRFHGNDVRNVQHLLIQFQSWLGANFSILDFQTASHLPL